MRILTFKNILFLAIEISLLLLIIFSNYATRDYASRYWTAFDLDNFLYFLWWFVTTSILSLIVFAVTKYSSRFIPQNFGLGMFLGLVLGIGIELYLIRPIYEDLYHMWLEDFAIRGPVVLICTMFMVLAGFLGSR